MERPRLARRLRRVVHLALGLCLVIAVVAMLPGRRIYSDANHCFGNGLAGLAATEHHGGTCTPSYTKLERTEPAGGWPAIGIVCVIALGAGMLHRKPRRSIALLFWVWCTLAALGMAGLMFDLDMFGHAVQLWPERVLWFAFGTLGVLVTSAPILAIVTREKASDSLPVARGSTGSR